MVMNTRVGRVDALIEAISALHPYDNPAIVALPVTAGSAAFLDWVRDETIDR